MNFEKDPSVRRLNDLMEIIEKYRERPTKDFLIIKSIGKDHFTLTNDKQGIIHLHYFDHEQGKYFTFSLNPDGQIIDQGTWQKSHPPHTPFSYQKIRQLSEMNIDDILIKLIPRKKHEDFTSKEKLPVTIKNINKKFQETLNPNHELPSEED